MLPAVRWTKVVQPLGYDSWSSHAVEKQQRRQETPKVSYHGSIRDY